MWSSEIRYSQFSVNWELSLIVCGCKCDHITALLRELHWLPLGHLWRNLIFSSPSYNHHLFQTYKPVRSLRLSTMNLLMTPRSKLKFHRTIMLFRFLALNFRMILQSTYGVKWSFNIRSSKTDLKALKTSKRNFYFVVLFNNFSALFVI